MALCGPGETSRSSQGRRALQNRDLVRRGGRGWGGGLRKGQERGTSVEQVRLQSLGKVVQAEGRRSYPEQTQGTTEWFSARRHVAGYVKGKASVVQSHPTLSVQFSRSVVSDSLWPHRQQHASFPVHHQLLELAKTHVHQVSDAILPSHPLSPPFPLAFNLSQHQGLFQWVSSSHQVAKGLEFQLQHQSFQWTFRTDFL